MGRWVGRVGGLLEWIGKHFSTNVPLILFYRVPYLAVARTFQAIEDTSARCCSVGQLFAYLFFCTDRHMKFDSVFPVDEKPLASIVIHRSGEYSCE